MNQKTKKILRRSLWTLIALIVLVLLLRPKVDFGNGESDSRASEQQSGSEGISAEAYVTEPREFRDQIRSTGSLLAEDEIEIMPEAAGRITELHIREGEEIEQGEPILKLNNADLQASLRRVGHDISLAEIKKEREKTLLENDAGTREAYDEARHQVDNLQAQRDELIAELEKTEISAPFSGVIGFKNVSQGSYVTTNTPITTLQKIDPIRVDFSVPERFRNQISTGQTIEFKVDGVEEWVEGQIYAIQPRVDRESRTIGLRARADNEDGLLLPGAFAQINIELGYTNDVVMIPSESLVPEADGYHVFIYADGKAKRTPVEVQHRTDTEIVIENGIAPGDTVLTTGILQLRDDIPVRLSHIHTQGS